MTTFNKRIFSQQRPSKKKKTWDKIRNENRQESQSRSQEDRLKDQREHEVAVQKSSQDKRNHGRIITIQRIS